MEISDIIRDAFYYPIDNYKRWFMIAVVYAILLFISQFGSYMSVNYLAGNTSIIIITLLVSVIIQLILSGFMVSISKTTLNKNDTIPKFNLEKDLLNGIKKVIITIFYVLIAIIITLILAIPLGLYSNIAKVTSILSSMPSNYPTFFVLQSIPPETFKALEFSLGSVMVLFGVLLIIVSIFLFLAQVSLAETGSIMAGCNIKALFNKMRRIGLGKFLTCLVMYAIIMFISLVLGMFVVVIPTYGVYIYYFIIVSFTSIFSARLAALIYMEG